MKGAGLVTLQLAPLVVWSIPTVHHDTVPAAIEHHRHLPPAPVGLPQPADLVLAVAPDSISRDEAIPVLSESSPALHSTSGTHKEASDLTQPIDNTHILILDPSKEGQWTVSDDQIPVHTGIQLQKAHWSDLGQSTRAFCVPAPKARNEKLGALLFAAFLVFVMVMETWKTAYNGLRDMITGRGPIRLEEKEGVKTTPLSVQAEPKDIEAAYDEGMLGTSELE